MPRKIGLAPPPLTVLWTACLEGRLPCGLSKGPLRALLVILNHYDFSILLGGQPPVGPWPATR